MLSTSPAFSSVKEPIAVLPTGAVIGSGIGLIVALGLSFVKHPIRSLMVSVLLDVPFVILIVTVTSFVTAFAGQIKVVAIVAVAPVIALPELVVILKSVGSEEVTVYLISCSYPKHSPKRIIMHLRDTQT